MPNLAKRTPEVEDKLKKAATMKPSRQGVKLVNIKIAEKRKEMR